MIRKEIVVHIYENEKGRHYDPIITLGIKEHTHLGMGGFVFDLTPAEADEIQGKLGEVLRRVVNRGSTEKDNDEEKL